MSKTRVSEQSAPGRVGRKLGSDMPFFYGLGGIALLYIGLIVALVLANVYVIKPENVSDVFTDENLVSSIKLTLLSCTITALLSVLVAMPIGYLLSRFRFPGRTLVDAVLDIPIVLPPLVVGLSLLILFNAIHIFPGDASLEKWLNKYGIRVSFSVTAVILAQFTVAAAFAIRMVKNTFDQIDVRSEHVALTLGCNRSKAFWRIALPQAGQGVVASGVLAWARALGEFGPILVFAGATPQRTQVLATSVFLEINIGNLSGAATISLMMIGLAIILIAAIRWLTGGKI